jgi:tetratricopeptide (TPR) repeat protein
MKSVLLALFVIILLTAPPAARAQQSMQLTGKQWLEDLAFVSETLLDHHPDIFYRISENEFEMELAAARDKIVNAQSDDECFAAVRRVVASIQDGHTVLGVDNLILAGYSEVFPIRLYEFYDGVYVTGIARDLAEHVGSRVIEVGQVTAEEALDRAESLAFADNGFYRMEQAPLIAVTCRLAEGLGITETPRELRLLVENETGQRTEFSISPASPTGPNFMLRGMDIGPPGVPFASAFTGSEGQNPAFLKRLDGNHNYWFEHDTEHRAIYMQFNLMADQEDESFPEFYRRMFKYIDDNAAGIDKFILDLRFNDGGSGPIALPFINELIKRDGVNQLGHLYTLIGRRSFSAAVLLVAEMMLHTQTLLVGEPTGAAQNMFSDMVFLGRLPHCNAPLILSSEYFNIAWPAGKNYMIPPHYPAQFSSSDFFSGRDPALEAIFAGEVRALETVLNEDGPQAALDYFKAIKRDWREHTAELCITPSTFPISAKYKGEFQINNLGYSLMGENRIEEARAAFELNVALYPKSSNAWDSYAEFLMKTGDNATAVEYYEESLELNPDNQNAADMIEQLRRQ